MTACSSRVTEEDDEGEIREGKSNWINKKFNLATLKEEKTYGALSGPNFEVASDTIKIILKQCLSKQYVTLSFEQLENDIVVKHWGLTALGMKIADEEMLHEELPDPLVVFNIIR